MELYLTEIRSGSLLFVVCLVGVWSVFGSVILFKIELPNTGQAHEKYL